MLGGALVFRTMLRGGFRGCRYCGRCSWGRVTEHSASGEDEYGGCSEEELGYRTYPIVSNVVKLELQMITSVAFDMWCETPDCGDCML